MKVSRGQTVLAAEKIPQSSSAYGVVRLKTAIESTVSIESSIHARLPNPRRAKKTTANTSSTSAPLYLAPAAGWR